MTDDSTLTRRLLIVVADGVRPDVLAEEIHAGRAPTLARLRERGGYYEVSSSFPSVTGPAYAPFVMGRHPAHVGLPGLRWYDRARSLRWSPSQARSYAGFDIWHLDGDMHADVPTLFDLARPSLSGMSMIGRGASHGRVGRSVLWSIRAAWAHFRSDLRYWRELEIALTNDFLARFAKVRPRSALLAIMSADKLAHVYGARSDAVRAAIGDIDAAVSRAQELATHGGWRDSLHVWVVGDHGHAPVDQHDDLHGWLESEGLRVLAHPRLGTRNADVALMVGGNAMAHLYLSPADRLRKWWPEHAPRSQRLFDSLLQRDSVDIAVVAMSDSTVRISHEARGSALVIHHDGGDAPRWSYVADDGDPLLLGGTLRTLDTTAAWEASATGEYPDAIVQLSTLGRSSRAGDIIVSASAGWDLRARFEPATHVSTHGAISREQMMVPLIVDTPVTRAPQRTADVVPSAMDLLGIPSSLTFDGRSFFR